MVFFFLSRCKIECNCCRLLRTNPSSRLLLPLARRGRPHLSSRSSHLLCLKCQKIKHQQEIDILKTEENFQRKNLYQTIINFDLSTEEQLALNNHQYQSAQMLVWKINNCNTIDFSYDINSLNDNEKKILLDDTIKKLQIILNNRSITTTTTTDHMDFTYRTLQTTINILSSSLSSSSHNSI